MPVPSAPNKKHWQSQWHTYFKTRSSYVPFTLRVIFPHAEREEYLMFFDNSLETSTGLGALAEKTPRPSRPPAPSVRHASRAGRSSTLRGVFLPPRRESDPVSPHPLSQVVAIAEVAIAGGDKLPEFPLTKKKKI